MPRSLCTMLLLLFTFPVWANVMLLQSSVAVNSPTDVALSPDDTQLYVANLSGSTIEVFNRDVDTGTLAHLQSRSGDAGLIFPWRLAASSDGGFVYVITHGSALSPPSSVDALLIYQRTADGTLSLIETLQNNSGGISDMSLPSDLTLSASGEHLYVRAADSNALLVFDRNAVTGRLTLTQTLRDGDAGVAGLIGEGTVSVSADDKFLYTTSSSSNSVTLFARDPVSKQLGMAKVYVNSSAGINSMGGAWSLALSPNQRHLYVSAGSDSSLVVFSRDEINGELTFKAAYHQGDTNAAAYNSSRFDGLSNPAMVKISPDGQRVYVSGLPGGAPNNVSTLAVLRRDAIDGSLSFIEVERSSSDAPIVGLGGALNYDVSHDGEYLYSAGLTDGNIGVFSHLNADLQMTMEADVEPVEPGADLNYTLTVTNNGSGMASGVAVSDPLPAEVTFISSDTPECQHNAAVVHCELGQLAVGAQAVITLQVSAPPSEGKISNQALVFSEFNDSNPTDNLQQLDTTVMRSVPNVIPVAVADIAYTFPGQPVVVNVLANDSDANGDTLTLVSVDKGSIDTQGILTIDSDSKVTYMPPAKQNGKDYNGVEHFKYLVSDGNGGEAEGQLTVVVNTDPDADNDTVNVLQGKSIKIFVLANDSDVDSNPIRLAAIDDSSLLGGSVQMNADDTLTYMADAEFVGNDVFDYAIEDSNGGMASAQVRVNVMAVNDDSGNSGGNGQSLRQNGKKGGGGAMDPVFMLMVFFLLACAWGNRMYPLRRC